MRSEDKEMRHGAELPCTLSEWRFQLFLEVILNELQTGKFKIQLGEIIQDLTFVVDSMMARSTGSSSCSIPAVVFFQYWRTVLRQASGSPYLPSMAFICDHQNEFFGRFKVVKLSARVALLIAADYGEHDGAELISDDIFINLRPPESYCTRIVSFGPR